MGVWKAAPLEPLAPTFTTLPTISELGHVVNPSQNLVLR